MSTIGERIKQLREQEGMTQKEFCDFVGISLDTLKGIESRGRDPRGSTLEKVAAKFSSKARFILLG